MEILSSIVIILGLCLFETVSSIDNAVINAEVLGTMDKPARRWFLTWGLLIAVVVVRGILPWLIVLAVAPSLGPLGSVTAAFSSDPRVHQAITQASPLLLAAGGTFLLFLFFQWLFQEPKQYGLKGERFFYQQSIWYYAVVSLLLTGIVWLAISNNSGIALGAVIGATVFFITHGFQENAELQEQKLLGKGNLSNTSKLIYLLVIDATFSMDGVLGAFAFTLSVPFILLGNGLGALVVRQLTVSNIERIKQYKYLKNGAMYSIFCLSIIMLLDAFGREIPQYVSPLATFIIVGYFFFKSYQETQA